MSPIITRIFSHSGLVCPRCERPLEGHSDADCARKMSRRFFFGVTLGAVAGAIVVPPVVNPFVTPTRVVYVTMRTLWMRDKGIAKFLDGKLIDFTPGDGIAPFAFMGPTPELEWLSRDELVRG